MKSSITARGRTALRLAASVGAAVVSLSVSTPAAAQRLEPKPLADLAGDIRPCPARPAPPLVPAEAAARVDSLLSAGTQATILGDNYSAGELLREAAALDPGNPVVAYRLARIHEERGEAELAVAEYCRYLLVSPQAPDAGEVQERIRTLAASAAEVNREEFEAAARAGWSAHEQRRYQAAVLAYTRALDMREGWATGYFNRGLARAGARDDQAAIADLERYLALNPDAEDRAAVEAHVQSLRSGTARRPPGFPSPGGVLAGGLIIPGMGQFVTRRPFGGIVVLAGTVGAAFWGMQQEAVTRMDTALDPFGNPYEVQVRSLERPNLAAGLGVAAGLALAGATEAYLYARRQHDTALPPEAQRSDAARGVTLHLAESSDLQRVEVGLRVSLPNGRP